MQSYSGAGTPAQDAQLYDRVARNAENACSALEQLLPLTRLVSGKIPLKLYLLSLSTSR